MSTPDEFDTTSWRGLTVAPDGTLTSAMGSWEWPKKEWAVATCDRSHGGVGGGKHPPPGQGCSCGIYSVEEWGQLVTLGYNYFDVSRTPGHLIWVIAHLMLKGGIVRSSNGVIRAERAYPLKVYVPGQHLKLGARIKGAYGCKIGVIDRFAKKGAML